MSEEDLILKLSQCPLLENVSEFLGWSRNGFDTQLGCLKSFLVELNRKNLIIKGEPFKIHLLETEPNVLLKLTNKTSIENLKNAIQRGDFVNATGHLISMIALQYKSISRAPHALLVNEMQSAMSVFLNVSAGRNHNVASEFENLFKILQIHKYSTQMTLPINAEFFTFIVELICRLPLNMQSHLLFSYVIDPLIGISNDRQIKEKLFAFVVTKAFVYYDKSVTIMQSDRRIEIFVKLGEICSITEWSKGNVDSITSVLVSECKNNVWNSVISSRTKIDTQILTNMVS